MRALRTEAVANTMPSTRTNMPPAEPIRLMMALALLRRGFTVTSGISATAGERKVAILTRTTSSRMMKNTSVAGLSAVTCQA